MCVRVGPLAASQTSAPPGLPLRPRAATATGDPPAECGVLRSPHVALTRVQAAWTPEKEATQLTFLQFLPKAAVQACARVMPNTENRLP